MTQGIVFNIQRYTIHDGPGIRTEIFLKGCPLSCKWCGNPESISSKLQTGYYSSKCLGMQKCNLCGGKRDDAEICPADAIKQWGKTVSVDEVMDIIRRDVSYYESSGGGVTISGGEPLMQPEFVKKLLHKCRDEKIHTCLESTFCVDWSIIENVAQYADMLITDIKHMDDDMHKKYTGVSNKKILENLSRLPVLDKPVIVRIPVIPSINDDMDNMEATADFIRKEMGDRVQQLQLLPFMRLGEEKYRSLGMDYPMEELEFDRGKFQERLQGMSAYFNDIGIPCQVGTKEK